MHRLGEERAQADRATTGGTPGFNCKQSILLILLIPTTLGINTDVEGVWLFFLIVFPVFALRDFLLCEKEKAEAFSGCQPVGLED